MKRGNHLDLHDCDCLPCLCRDRHLELEDHRIGFADIDSLFEAQIVEEGVVVVDSCIDLQPLHLSARGRLDSQFERSYAIA
jgi:hypothetical protein